MDDLLHVWCIASEGNTALCGADISNDTIRPRGRVPDCPRCVELEDQPAHCPIADACTSNCHDKSSA